MRSQRSDRPPLADAGAERCLQEQLDLVAFCQTIPCDPLAPSSPLRPEAAREVVGIADATRGGGFWEVPRPPPLPLPMFLPHEI